MFQCQERNWVSDQGSGKSQQILAALYLTPQVLQCFDVSFHLPNCQHRLHDQSSACFTASKALTSRLNQSRCTGRRCVFRTQRFRSKRVESGCKPNWNPKTVKSRSDVRRKFSAEFVVIKIVRHMREVRLARFQLANQLEGRLQV